MQGRRIADLAARSGLRALSPAVLGALFAGWLGLALANYALHRAGLDPGTSRTFPISIFQPELHVSGLPFAAAFGLVLALALAQHLQEAGGPVNRLVHGLHLEEGV